MPVLLVTTFRFLVVAIAQTGAWIFASEALERVVDYIRNALKTDGDLTDEEVDHVLSDEILDAVALIGVTVASLKTKLPIRLADKLGLKVTPTKKRSTTQTTAKVQNATKKAKLLGKAGVSGLLSKLAISFVVSLPWLPSLVQQFGDQATFSPVNANNYYEQLFGVRPFKEPNTLESPPPFSKVEFTDYAQSLEIQGITGINDPYKFQTLQYTRTALAELVFGVYGDNIAQGIKLTYAKIVPILSQYLILPGRTTPTLQNRTTLTTAQSAATSKKVFVGTVGQGTLTTAAAFEPQPDDLITSADELESALRDNLALYLQSALGRFVYESKVVSSVTTKDGFTQRGQSQQVQTGTYPDGRPKYKTVVNKFAVVDVYFLTERGTRTKAARIVLGPTDALRFQPTAQELGALDLNIKDSITTTSLDNVAVVKEGGSTTILNKPDEQPLAVQTFTRASQTALSRLFRAGASNGNPPPDQLYADTGKRIYELPNLHSPGVGIWDTSEEYLKAHAAGKHYEITEERLKTRYGIDFQSLPARNPADLPQQALRAGYDWQEGYDPGRGRTQNPIYNAKTIDELISFAAGATSTLPIGVGPACLAKNLTEFFEARGEKLPDVKTRSVLYEQYGLGSRAFYTGTGTQNVKLLSKLKEQAGCPA